jgi:4'-phosphopantetheinyl transferase
VLPIPTLRLNEGDVGVWILTLPVGDALCAEAWRFISQDERERANRLVRDADRALWIHTRAVMRRLLAGYLSIEPQLIVFGEGPQGKPEVSKPANDERLEFSVAHSGAVAAITIALDRRVGIDVERIQPDLSWEPIAKKLFSPADVAFIEDRPPAERRLTFFEYWVRKESYLKGLGVGLRRTLDDFSVPMGGVVGVVVEDREARPSPDAGAGWRIHPVDVPDGYAAALAVQGGCNVRTVKIRCSARAQPPGKR